MIVYVVSKPPMWPTVEITSIASANRRCTYQAKRAKWTLSVAVTGLISNSNAVI